MSMPLRSVPAARGHRWSVPRRTRVDVSAITLAGDGPAIAVAVLAFAAVAALTWGAWGDLAHDTGYDWIAADRIAGGQVPYVDFPYAYGPLAAGVLGAAFALLGSSVATAAGVGLLLAAAAVALVYRLARELTTPAGAAAAALLASVAALATGNKGLAGPHTLSASVAVVTVLAALLAASVHARTRRRGALAVAATAAGLTGLTRPEFAGAVDVALALWLGLRVAATARAARPRALGDAALAGLLALGIPIAAYAVLAVLAGPGTLANQLLARDELAAGAGDVLRAAAPLTAGSVIDLLASTVVYAAGTAALVALGLAWAAGGSRRRLAQIVLGCAALALAGVLLASPEVLRSRLAGAFAWVPAGAAVALAICVRNARRADRWSPHDQAALLVSAATAVLAAKTYAAFDPQPNPEHPQAAIYALPFAAVLMAWIHGELLAGGRRAVGLIGVGWLAALGAACLALTATDGRRETGRVSGPGGTVAAPLDQAVPLQAALDALRRRTRPGEPVLLAPQLTALYTISGRTNPLPAISLLPGTIAGPAEEDDAIRRLAGVRVAVVDTRPRTEYGQGAFGVTYDRRLGAWLRGEFRRVATFHGAGRGAMTLELWQRSAA